MPSDGYDATPKEIRLFAVSQVGLTGAFLVLLFFILGGTDADYPPIWLAVLLVVLIGVGAFFAERAWLSASPLAPDAPAHELTGQAINIYTSQMVRKVAICGAPLIFAVIVAFVGSYGGWPLVIAGFPGLAVLAWETWPSLRNTSMTAAMLESQGAETRLVERFLES
ncbi:hypothetical protein [Aeromicrobium sp.]|uniref:hypothetical protein n=1 Tax=Aeromicrobium sp. TaxID=1871063 RepID=UPI0030BEDC0D